MQKAIDGPEEFKAITDKKVIPEIEDSEESRLSFKEYILKTFKS
jgi:hypothetical protein